MDYKHVATFDDFDSDDFEVKYQKRCENYNRDVKIIIFNFVIIFNGNVKIFLFSIMIIILQVSDVTKNW